MVRRNLLANYLGQAWSAIMAVAFVPVYIRYLGIEAYGLIGFFSLLYAALVILDAGLTPALGREMSRLSSGERTPQSARHLLRTVEIVLIAVCLVIVTAFWMGAQAIATRWLNSKSLPVDVITLAIVVMGGVISLRMIESIYRSALVGLQQQVSWNAVLILSSTARWAGAAIVLQYLSGSIIDFFLWQALVSMATILGASILTYRFLPTAIEPARFSLAELGGIYRFAGGLGVIALLSFILMNLDKILVSRLLSLEDFGAYSLVAVVTGSIYLTISPITQACYPRICELVSRRDERGMAAEFHRGAQLVSAVAGTAGVVIVVYASSVLHVWVGDSQITSDTARLLSIMALGTVLNAMMWMPHHAQLAHGWTSLSIKTNVLAIAVVVPALAVFVPEYGVFGAAWCWVALNAAYVLVAANFMFRRILKGEKTTWYVRDVLVPTLSVFFVCSLLKCLLDWYFTDISDLGALLLAISLGSLVAIASAPEARRWAIGQRK